MHAYHHVPCASRASADVGTGPFHRLSFLPDSKKQIDRKRRNSYNCIVLKHMILIIIILQVSDLLDKHVDIDKLYDCMLLWKLEHTTPRIILIMNS